MKIEPGLISVAERVAAHSIQPREVQADRSSRALSVAGPERSCDSAVLSERARDVRAAQRAFEQLPAFRAERIEAIKTQIAEGTLKIDAEQIADGLLQHVL